MQLHAFRYRKWHDLALGGFELPAMGPVVNRIPSAFQVLTPA